MNPKQTKLWTALITPMDENGRVDFDDLATLVDKQEKAGNGILLLGSTGEGLALNVEEKSEVVEFVMKNRPDTPVMVGVGGFNIRSQQAWIEQCSRLDVDAFLLVAPLYSKPGPVGMEIWFRTLLDSVDKPCMIYNIPGRTGVRIPPEVIANLSGHENMWSLKEASGSIEDYKTFREQAPGLSIYSGDDGMLPAFSAVGCEGLVSVAANVWPEPTGRYVELCLSGETSDFGSVWSEGSKALFCVSNPIPSKILLVEKGWIGQPTLRLPLTSREEVDKRLLLQADKAVMDWYAEEKKATL